MIRFAAKGLSRIIDRDVTGGGTALSSRWSFGNTAIPFEQQAGDLHTNGALFVCLHFLCKKAAQARPRLEKLVEGSWRPSEDSVAADIARSLITPNNFYGWGTLISGAIISKVTDGNGWWLPRFRNDGQVGGFFFFPHFDVTAYCDRHTTERGNATASPGELITRVDLRQFGGGRTFEVEYSDMVHLRETMPDPRQPALGLSRVKAMLRDVVGDNEAATYTALIMQTLGVPGAIFSPKTGERMSLKNDENGIQRLWSNSTTLDARGKAFFSPVPVDVTIPAFSPEQMVLEKVRSIPAERICAAVGVDPMAVHLPSSNKTYSNFAEAREAAIEDFVLPELRSITDQISAWMLPRFKVNVDNFRVGFDQTVYRELDEDQNELHSRARDDFEADLITLNEARAMTNRPEVTGGEIWKRDIDAAKAATAAATIEKQKPSKSRMIELIEDAERLEAIYNETFGED